MRDLINIVENQELIRALDPLKYSMDALEPVMSEHSVQVHYEILTRKYFEKYEATGDLFQRAGAVLHNEHFWPMLKPYDPSNTPGGTLLALIRDRYGSFDEFAQAVLDAALKLQGNGWVFVMSDLQIQTVQNHVVKDGIALAIDLWEHTTVDYDFDKSAFFKEFWAVVDWDEVEDRVGK